jgi:diguanylate cyclase (GGDEF)-like protein
MRKPGEAVADPDEVADTRVALTPVGGPVADAAATVQALEAIVGFERGLPVGAPGRYPDAVALREALEPVFEGSLDLVGIVDDDGGIVYLNAAARSRFGQSEEAGYSAERLYPPAALDIYYREIRPTVLARGAWRGVLPMRTASGDVVHVRQSITGGVGVNGDTIEWLLSIAEDTREAQPVWPERAASRDVLTGLANRSWFDERLAEALMSVHDDGASVGVVHCDLVTLTEVHDAFGASIANVVLIEMGRRLVSLSGPTDVVARYGDRELVVMSESHVGARAIARLAWRVRNELCAAPVSVGEQSLAIDGIVGVATASTPGREVADLIAAARARGRATAHG